MRNLGQDLNLVPTDYRIGAFPPNLPCLLHRCLILRPHYRLGIANCMSTGTLLPSKACWDADENLRTFKRSFKCLLLDFPIVYHTFALFPHLLVSTAGARKQ
jgi:hypothetical protein